MFLTTAPTTPFGKAEKFCATLPVQKADVVMMFGWGLGYLGEALLKRLKTSARIIVFEPDEELYIIHDDDFCVAAVECGNAL